MIDIGVRVCYIGDILYYVWDNFIIDDNSIICLCDYFYKDKIGEFVHD
jgi:hypothetical protein